MNSLIPVPVLLPLLGAGLTLVLVHRPRAQRAVSVAVLVAVVALAAYLLWAVDEHGTMAVWVGGWEAPLGISLVADRLSTLMLLVSSSVALAVLVYSIGQGMIDDDESAPVSIYHPTFLVLVAGVSNAFLAGDLFNIFVSFEMLLFASYVLLTLGGTESRIRAGTIYVVVNMLSSMLFLISIAAVYGATGSVNLARLHESLAQLPDPVALTLQLLLLTTFGVKAAMFPLGFWLPDSYPTAPAPVTAVFAGLLTKVGVYAILRTQTLLFPDRPLTDLLLVVAVLTMVVGILGAVAQSDLKRLLSFTLVSHIGYMIFGIALATKGGVSGAVFYVAHHITIQTALFLVLGLLERRAGSTSLVRLGGLARIAPLIAVLFFVPAMNLAGIPPLSGFIGKIGLMSAGVETGTPLAYVLVAASAVTSLLTLYAIAKAWSLAFWRTPAQAHELALAIVAHEQTTDDAVETTSVPVGTSGRWQSDALVEAESFTLQREEADDDERRRKDSEAGPEAFDTEDDETLYERELRGASHQLPRSMVGATVALVAASVMLSVIGGPLYGLADRASADLLDPQDYVQAVLPTVESR
ncbi:Na+/H+ antiporter subunit D [Janibacter melonis]|uniref:Na+/H+ antiporter subunit D n=1 Tax=Janibacter melonis TaxID=262209 RepID=A0A5P8FJM4_9MICO|nr:Na+/H+ antiporter subunit D [Janibacter melonis]QFQ29755.2 Na+/H+ antiporter subunit D [Janibacter melonis]